MKIKDVTHNNKKREFSVVTSGGAFSYPYSALKTKILKENQVVSVSVDCELAKEAFVVEFLCSKPETVHIEQVLEYNKDPEYLCELLLHELTIKALKALASRKTARRELARRLGTSPKQIYRLLDPAFYGKSINQMVKLLYILGEKVEVTTKRAA